MKIDDSDLVLANPLPLTTLAEIVGGEVIQGDMKKSVSLKEVAIRSDEVLKGGVFVALRGTQADGHTFLRDVAARGASVAIVEQASSHIPGLTLLKVEDTRKALSRIASYRTGHAPKSLFTVGVTGTNGKTTTVNLTSALLTALGTPSVSIGTLGLRSPTLTIEGSLTTPDPLDLYSWCTLAKKKGFEGVVMEASSHALDQSRVSEMEFNTAVFTNLTRDHLDYHKTEENYFLAKAHLFKLLSTSAKSNKHAIINADDPYGARLVRDITPSINLLRYGNSPSYELCLRRMERDSNGSRLSLSIFGKDYEVLIPLIGEYNGYNTIAAIGVALSNGKDLNEILTSLESLPQVPGRLQRVCRDQVEAFIDYAHTPDALERALKALREGCQGDLWVVFGCGGDRDRGKRPIMGEIAGRLADKVIVTSDNPRSEDPRAIIADVLSDGLTPYATEPDRAKAINIAVQEAQPGDRILIAGKGHEDYQEVAGVKKHFSDVEKVEEAFALKRNR